MNLSALLGRAGLFIALLAFLAALVSFAFSLRSRDIRLARRARGYVMLGAFGALSSCVVLDLAFVRHDFSLRYVAFNNSTTTPLQYSLAGLWASLEGSLLLWASITAACAVVAARSIRRESFQPVAIVTTLVVVVVAAYFFVILLFAADPFVTISRELVPQDGRGPNPLLQNHILMAIHPPVLYVGYIAFVLPFARSIASLVVGENRDQWIRDARKPTIIAWAFLTLGVTLGAWWSYEVLGWGGYWSWDPVENASLIPWLLATAFVHTLLAQSRRGVLRTWNYLLVAATFALTILGTYFTRSGALQSVHAFSASNVGPWLLALFAATILLSGGLVFWRADRFVIGQSISDVRSRESAIMWANVLLTFFAGVVLLGTVFPLLAESFGTADLAVGSPYFMTIAKPFGIALLLLLAIGPLFSWKSTSRDTLRKRLLLPVGVFAVAFLAMSVVLVLTASSTRSFLDQVAIALSVALCVATVAVSFRKIFANVRSHQWRGVFRRSSFAMLAHVGFAVLALALVFTQSYTHRVEKHVRVGDAFSAFDSRFSLEYFGTETTSNRAVTRAIVRIDNTHRYSPRVIQFKGSSMSVGTPSVHSRIDKDIYLTITQLPNRDDEPIGLSVVVTPFVWMLWMGGVVIAFAALGTVLSPEKGKP